MGKVFLSVIESEKINIRASIRLAPIRGFGHKIVRVSHSVIVLTED